MDPWGPMGGVGRKAKAGGTFSIAPQSGSDRTQAEGRTAVPWRVCTGKGRRPPPPLCSQAWGTPLPTYGPTCCPPQTPAPHVQPLCNPPQCLLRAPHVYPPPTPPPTMKGGGAGQGQCCPPSLGSLPHPQLWGWGGNPSPIPRPLHYTRHSRAASRLRRGAPRLPHLLLLLKRGQRFCLSVSPCQSW